MKIFKKSGKIYLTNLTFLELASLLKIQIDSEIIFVNNNKQIDNEKIIKLGERVIQNRIQKINFTINDIKFVENYDILLNKISIFNKNTTLMVKIEQNTYREQDNLINLIPKISKEIVENCVFLKLKDSVYSIKYKPFINDDSNMLYYFELNNTLLAFTETGPELITESLKINNITDIICN